MDIGNIINRNELFFQAPTVAVLRVLSANEFYRYREGAVYGHITTLAGLLATYTGGGSGRWGDKKAPAGLFRLRAPWCSCPRLPFCRVLLRLPGGNRDTGREEVAARSRCRVLLCLGRVVSWEGFAHWTCHDLDSLE